LGDKDSEFLDRDWSQGTMMRQGGGGDSREREYYSKWVTLSATIIVMLSAGMNYTFSMWGGALGRRLGYSQEQMSALATWCSIGSYLNVFPGAFYDRVKVHDRGGPKATLLVGVLCQTVGFLGLWLGATQKLPIPYPVMCLLAMIACNCGPWFETGCMVTSVRNFEADRFRFLPDMSAGYCILRD
jgi:hypothetical protein